MAVSSYIPPLLIAEGHRGSAFRQKETAALITQNRRRNQLCRKAREILCPSAVFFFPRCGGRCFILIYHKHNLQMLYKLPTAKRIASRIDGTGITTIRMTPLLAASMNVPKTPRSTPSFSVGRLFKVTAGRMDVSKGLLYDGFFLLPPFNKSIHI